jgi:hypothetical protein
MPHSDCVWFEYSNFWEGAPCWPSVTIGASISCQNDENGNAQWWLYLTVSGWDACDNYMYYDGQAPIGKGQCPNPSGPFEWEPEPHSDPQEIPFDVTVVCND